MTDLVFAPVTVTGEARSTLAAALTDPCAPWPVHRHRPVEVTAPMVYVDAAGRRYDEDDGAPLTVVTFPVVAVADGADDAQLDMLDSIGDRVWTTAESLDAFPTRADAGYADVGGPTLRTVTTYVDVPVNRSTLCDPGGP